MIITSLNRKQRLTVPYNEACILFWTRMMSCINEEKRSGLEKREGGREGGVVEQQSNLRVGSTGMSDSNREKRTVLLLIVYSGTLI